MYYFDSDIGDGFSDKNEDRFGKHKTSTELSSRATYENDGWDFNKVWAKNETFDHPTLRVIELMNEND